MVMFQAIREKATGRLTEWREIDPDPPEGIAPVMTPTDPANYELKNYDFDPQTAAEKFLKGGNPGVIYVDDAGKVTAEAVGPSGPPPQSADIVKALCNVLEGLGATDSFSMADLKAAASKLQDELRTQTRQPSKFSTRYSSE